MREIKFRAWDKKHNKMLFPLSGILWGNVLVPTNYAQGVFDGDIPKNCRDFFEGEMVMMEGVELMQFTGLLDKNGREIYEGDILDIENTTAKVVFWERPPAFGLDPINEHEWCEDWNITDDSDRMSVIGNIYEKPDLLKQQRAKVEPMTYRKFLECLDKRRRERPGQLRCASVNGGTFKDLLNDIGFTSELSPPTSNRHMIYGVEMEIDEQLPDHAIRIDGVVYNDAREQEHYG